MSKTEAQESSISDADIACESRFECPICLAWLRDPVLTSCGHRFCRLCIQSWLQKEGACPVDNIKLIPSTDLFPDNFTRREILQQKTICPYNTFGCTVKLSPLDMENHVVECKYKITETGTKPMKCLFHDAGCAAEFKTNEESQDHISKNMNYHLTLLCCVYSQLKSKCEMPNGSTASDKSQESFFWDPPTKDRSSSEGAESSESVHNLLKVLYEKIVLLEQKNREQDIIITNMSQQITVHNSKISDLPLRYCNGCYLWTVPDFNSKLSAMRIDHKKMYYSLGFYTAPNGYRLCMRLNLSPNDPNYLALIVHVMKSEHDFMLDWPLNARITIILIHPNNPSINIRESMLTKPELAAFTRPTQALNPRGFGYTEFAIVQDLLSEGFIKNNELHIKIQVYTA